MYSDNTDTLKVLETDSRSRFFRACADLQTETTTNGFDRYVTLSQYIERLHSRASWNEFEGILAARV
jgi:hypothetical protein